MISWFYLCVAILLEVAGTTSMKFSEGFTKPLPSILLVVFYIGSLICLTLTLKTIDISVAYAIWSGMGILLISCLGFFYFQESISLVKIMSILLIVIGVTTLYVSSETDKSMEKKQTESVGRNI